jgi:hypothetical protein
MASRHLLVALILVGIPCRAAADSDGYFCIASGLLAFDSFVPGEAGRIIKVVRFDVVRGIQPAEEFRIDDDFQTHGMSCDPKTVKVYSWDTLYSIDISIPLMPKLAEKRPYQRGKSTALPNLGHWARGAQVVQLEPSNGEHRFELVIARAGFFIKGKGGVTYTSTELVHRVGHEVRAHQRLFFGVFLETVD